MLKYVFSDFNNRRGRRTFEGISCTNARKQKVYRAMTEETNFQTGNFVSHKQP